MNARILQNMQPMQGNGMNLQQMMIQTMQALQQSGYTPEQAVRAMMEQGRISKEQFEQYSNQANQMFGQKR